MDIEHNDNPDNPPPSGAGTRLRAAREALRRDLLHIAAETRIPLRHLEAIEEGNFEALPSRAYAIGFSRTFAKVVGLDPADITDAVRAELTEGAIQRAVPSSAMEPGDPGRLPSSGLAWATALAALVLAVGGYAFYNAYFGAGTVPGSLLVPETSATPAPIAGAEPTGQESTPGKQVVLTALEDDIWLRLYEQGGERLTERTLKQGETVLVPGGAADPRINTGRPDALAISVGGKDVAKLADRATTLSGAAVSAAALLGRAAAPADVAAAAAPPATTPAVRRAAEQRPVPAATLPRETPPAVTTDPVPAAVAEASPSASAAESAEN